MSWTAYQLVFRLESPLHVGWRKTGNLMQTRAYVPGRIFWGAVTANLTRCLGYSNYEAIGNLVRDHLRFGYFFLAVEMEKPLIPRQKNSDVVNGDGDRKETAFHRKFISSVASTVIAPDSFAAQEGSLHEVEFITPSIGVGAPVFLVGHLFVNPNNEIDVDDGGITYQGISLFDDVLHSLQIGGERRYGYGKITLHTPPRLMSENKIFNYSLHLDNLQVDVPRGKPFLAHVHVEGVSAVGEVEPLVSREWAQESSENGKSGAGHLVSNLGICYAPGGVSENAETFTIGDYGVWEKLADKGDRSLYRFLAL